MRDFFHTSVAATICLFSFLILTLTPSASAQYIGEVETVGETWQDYQHNGSCGRMIRVDANGNIHVVWTKLWLSPNYSRHVYYNFRDSTSWQFGSGIGVESSIRSGYTCLAVDSDGYPYPAFHVITTSTNPDAEAACARDIFYGVGAFVYGLCPFVFRGGTRLEVIWPKIAIDIDDRIHMINTYNPGVAGDPLQIFYIGGEYNASMMEFSWDDSQTVIDWVMTTSADIAASRYSERVAFVYTDIIPTFPIPGYPSDTTRYNNDIYLVVSEDGINWNFQDPINVTNFIMPDTSLLPDSTLANRDTLRAYTDASIIFDSDDNIHVAFTTPGYYSLQRLVSISNSLIWHWTDLTENYGLIADGWFGDNVVSSCGAWQRYVQRPCLAEDESTGDLYCTYMLYDTADITLDGYPQAEVIVTQSRDHGESWAVGTNVSNSHAPGAHGPFHLSERDITCNETVEDNALHLLYILDTWAGNNIQIEEISLCPVHYQRVPIDSIAYSPRLPYYPIHVDSTGFPPLSVKRHENANIPTEFHLAQNYPNPFNPTTTITFDLNRTDHITLRIYNILGREIETLVDANLIPGTYKVLFTADNLSSGIYFYTLKSSTLNQTKKMVLLK